MGSDRRSRRPKPNGIAGNPVQVIGVDMQKFTNVFRAFRACKAVDASLVAHANSEFALQKQEEVTRARYQAYLDLENWPASPLLVGMSAPAKAELRNWGDEYTAVLNAFHAQTNALQANRLTALQEALYALGVQAGQEFLKSVGALDRRLAKVTIGAGSVRCNMLDGKRYVSVFEEGSNFAKGFFQATKLKHATLLADLKQSRTYNGVLHSGGAYAVSTNHRG
jgi:hypothetical protein